MIRLHSTNVFQLQEAAFWMAHPNHYLMSLVLQSLQATFLSSAAEHVHSFQ
jgi:hypothetical protein